jgi:hypothetical protein
MKPQHFYLTITIFVIMLCASGCRKVQLSDNIDTDFNWRPLEGITGTLHNPYVVGSTVRIYAEDNRRSDKESNWTLESSNENVLHVDSYGEGSIVCTAVGVGESDIYVYDEDGERIHTQTLRVLAPTHTKIYSRGPILVGDGFEAAQIEEPVRILSGGTATFLVHYYHNDTRLYGTGTLTATSREDVLLYEETTVLLEQREWLQVTPNAEGIATIDLGVKGGDSDQFDSFQIQGVSAEDIHQIDLIGESEDLASDESSLVVLAQAYDAQANPIYGVEYRWDVDGQDITGDGDLYRYVYDHDTQVNLGAHYDELSDDIQIHASSGEVTSTNDLGCSVTSVHPSSTTPFLGFMRSLLFE